ncbi:VanZ family protein [Dyadobacter sp. CY323]|uniref:VanZ family protein n=1 Tax=Dyadobacter sp. CY323 TaxID=2907302 RepID=UPI001F3C0ACC|nr:VanZ family protein [Dyadobacter sp. CY323]MCE6990055.1 VanZ family protein [Dyadobacter sp. CY323]
MFRSIISLLSKRPWLAWFWTLLILTACTWPGKDIPAAPVVGFDKIVHTGLFIVWITLWILVYPQKSTLLVIAGMAYGLGLEFYQQLLPFDRTFDWWDAAADAAGVLIGYLFTALVINRYRQRLY